MGASGLNLPPSFAGSYFRGYGIGYNSILTASMLIALRGAMTAFSIFRSPFRPNTSADSPGNQYIGAVFPNDAPWKNENGGNAGTITDVDSYLNTFGTADAYDAFDAALNLGQPSYTPIYFAIDVNLSLDLIGTTANQAPLIASRTALIKYFSDVAAAFNDKEQTNHVRYYVGVYGFPSTLDVCYAQNNVSYFYPVNTASLPFWPHANLCQLAPSAIAGGLSVDIDFAWGDEGSWMT